MSDLKKNFVFILGGSSGIGRSILEKLAAELEYSTIVFTWRRKSALQKIDLKSLVRNGNELIPRELDTAEEFEEIKELEDLTRNCERAIFVACAFELETGCYIFYQIIHNFL